MKRVHRKLSKAEIDALREQLATLIPAASEDIGTLIRTMRLATRRSQVEYAGICNVAPRVLADIEAGRRNVRVETLEKLLLPFGYRIGIVSQVKGLKTSSL